MRGILLLVVGLLAGLAAGWAIFGAHASASRAPHRETGTEAPAYAGDEATVTESGDTGPMHGATGASAEARRSVRPPDPEERIVRSLMRDAYDGQVTDGKAPEEDIFEAGVREVLRRSARNREADARNIGSTLPSRERMRAEAGEIRGSPLVLQICGSGSVRLTDRGNSERFDVGGPPPQGAKLMHVSGGTVPPGKVFLIERAVLRAQSGPYGWFHVTLPEMDRFDWDSRETGKKAIDMELKGLVPLAHGQEGRVQLVGSDITISVEIHGRLVPDAEGEAEPTRQLLMGEGWLTGEPVLMQVRADHGGGNDRKVYLNGKLYRIDALEPGSIWEDSPDLDRRGSFAHYRGCGLVPPGKAYRVTRIEYRARLDPRQKAGSRMTICVGGKDEVKADASQGGSVAGTWTGDVLVVPGRESDVSVTCNYYGLAEITVFGELVDPPPTKK